MARKPKFTVDAEVKNEFLQILFAGEITPEVAEKLLAKNWAENLFNWAQTQVEKPVEEEKPITKNVKYKQAYLKLAKQIEKMNELVKKIGEETNEPVNE